MTTRGRPPHPDILTPREWEVFELVREGLNNPQIAERLDITRAAVKYHVSEILGKLAAVSRDEAAAWDPRQRPDWTPRWDPTRRPTWATALAPIGFFWRGLRGGLAHSAGSLATAATVVLGVAVVGGVTTFGVLVMRTRGSSHDASATPPAVVAQSTGTGKIAFVSNRDGDPDIYVVNSDGSGLTNLTKDPGCKGVPQRDPLPPPCEEGFGAWSPDGSRIAFDSARDGNGEIYVVNTDGSGLTNLTKDPGEEGFGDWSPAGTRIAFTTRRDGNQEIYVVNPDGSGLTNLTKDPGDDGFGAWAPDGNRIAFNSDRDGGNNDIYVMAADGSNVTRLTNLTNNQLLFGLGWSPDGSLISFLSYGVGTYIVNADGSGLTNFTSNGGNADGSGLPPRGVNLNNSRGGNGGNLLWSPDGSRIALNDNRDGNYEIYVVNADGSGLTNLSNSVVVAPSSEATPTNHPGDDLRATWSPDGSRIAFMSDRDGNQEIYVMNADGSGQTNLTNNPADDGGTETGVDQGLGALVWSPDGSRIAFMSYRDGNWEIYVMNADGSGQTNLTNNPGPDLPGDVGDRDPVWSPAH